MSLLKGCCPGKDVRSPSLGVELGVSHLPKDLIVPDDVRFLDLTRVLASSTSDVRLPPKHELGDSDTT